MSIKESMQKSWWIKLKSKDTKINKKLVQTSFFQICKFGQFKGQWIKLLKWIQTK